MKGLLKFELNRSGFGSKPTFILLLLLKVITGGDNLEFCVVIIFFTDLGMPVSREENKLCTLLSWNFSSNGILLLKDFFYLY